MRNCNYRRARKKGGSAVRSGKSRSVRRLDVTGTFFLLAVIAFSLAVLFAISAPGASAAKDGAKPPKNSAAPILDKKFKGDLPITELTEDQAILHALNRLAYGPRPGDVERVRQMGLAK